MLESCSVLCIAADHFLFKNRIQPQPLKLSVYIAFHLI